MLSYFLAWFPILLLAVMNGAARDFLYKKKLGDAAAHQVSTLLLLALFTFYLLMLMRQLPPESETEAVRIGLLWLVLTLGFEFGFGRFQGHSWQHLFGEYNVLKGKLWLLVPLWVAIAPYLLYKLQH